MLGVIRRKKRGKEIGQASRNIISPQQDNRFDFPVGSLVPYDNNKNGQTMSRLRIVSNEKRCNELYVIVSRNERLSFFFFLGRV